MQFKKHLSCKQFQNIVKGDSTFLRSLRNLQNIHGVNRTSRPKLGFCFMFHVETDVREYDKMCSITY